MSEIASEQSPLHKLVGIPNNLPRSGAKVFVGREEVLELVREQLQTSERVAITAIAGMGGIGKTELALQYAQREYGRQTYPAGVCWIRARNEEISGQIVSFAEVHLGLTVPREQLKTPEEQVAFCWRCWPVGSVLVVLDDVVVYGDVERFLPPTDLRFKVLMTTRQADLATTVESVRLDVLDEAGALALLRSLLGEARVDREREAVQELCERLGYLPLGLSLVGSYLAKKRDCSLAKMLERLEKKGLEARALRKVEDGMTAQLGVRAAFVLSWDALDEKGQFLACFLGCFALAPVPWWLVEGALCKKDSELDEEELEEVRDEQLCGLSLLERVGDGIYRLHQLVWEFFRARLEEHEQQDRIERVLCYVGLSLAIQMTNKPVLKQMRFAELMLIPHMKEVTKISQSKLNDEALLCIFRGIGDFYSTQGKHGLAQSWREQQLDLARQCVGEKHLLFIANMNMLAINLKSQGKYDEAESLYLQALRASKKVLGEESYATAMVTRNLAILYKIKGAYKKAERLYLRALEISENIIEQDHHFSVGIKGHLAVLYRVTGKHGKAENLQTEVLEEEKKNFGEIHPDTATTISNLATIYYEQARYEKAGFLYCKALETRKRIFGTCHPDTAKSMRELAKFYRFQGRYKESLLLHLQALDVMKYLYGSGHPELISSMNSLALIYADLGQGERAEVLLCENRKVISSVFGKKHIDMAICMNNLASVYKDKGKLEEAKSCHLQALSLFKDLLGENHPHVVTAMNNLASTYSRLGHWKIAESMYSQALRLAKEIWGDKHFEVANTIHNLAGLYLDRGDFRKAELLLRNALTLKKEILDENHPSIYISLKNLVVLYAIRRKIMQKQNPFTSKFWS